MSDEMRQKLRDEGREQFERVVTELEREEPDMEVIRQAVLAGLSRLEPIGFTLHGKKERNPDDVVAISRGVPPKKNQPDNI
jgi:hypothetical protein